MIIKNVNLETVCGITSKLPENSEAEIAFAGKSNVGKSSLINALINRKAYARTSSEPGKTQTVNFYKVCGRFDMDGLDREFYYVDLPGYGYARVSAGEREKWGKMIENYLHTSPKLRCVFLLVDIRHEPSANDRQMFEWIVANGFRPVVIGTKLDKINRSQIAKQTKLIRTGLGMDKEDIFFAFSAQSKQGREEIWKYIEGVISQ
ncbi:MAG: ribosome biogenesis GTP-binding protein YihA/YsxC [Lachnospiraceae bacterium]|nr:ribosome biogenesis GTP-binding protein YihA/YsxC [Lachnospiraceae bacterium]